MPRRSYKSKSVIFEEEEDDEALQVILRLGNPKDLGIVGYLVLAGDELRVQGGRRLAAFIYVEEDRPLLSRLSFSFWSMINFAYHFRYFGHP